jgi:hypothetical protein
MKIYRLHVRHAASVILMCLLSITLSGCFFLPGRFSSELDIRSDGRFVYKYTGEIVFLLGPLDRTDEKWDDNMAICYSETPNDFIERTCTAAELSAQRAEFENKQKQVLESDEDIAALIGFNPFDPASNAQFAAQLRSQPGWKSVQYLGRGRFYVNYEIGGSIDRDFAFPIVPQAQMAMPFVLIAPMEGNRVSIQAAGLASPQFRKIMLGEMRHSNAKGLNDPFREQLLGLARGTFKITTDAEIIGTNGIKSDGPHDASLSWKIEGAESDTPMTELVLRR